MEQMMLSPVHPDTSLSAEEVLLLPNDDLNIHLHDQSLSSKSDGLTVNFCFHELGCRQDVQRSSSYVKADNVNAGESHGPFVDVSDDYSQQDIFQKIYNDIKSESTTFDQLIGSSKKEDVAIEQSASIVVNGRTSKKPVNYKGLHKPSEPMLNQNTRVMDYDDHSASLLRLKEICYTKPTSPTPGGPFDGDDQWNLLGQYAAHIGPQAPNYGNAPGQCSKRRSPECNLLRHGHSVTKKQATERYAAQCYILSACKFFSKKNGSACSKEVHRVPHKRGHLTVACSDRHQWVWCPLCCDCERPGRPDSGNHSAQGCRNVQHWFERDSFDTGVRNHMNSLHKK